MFGKDKCFAFEKYRPDYIWTGERWRLDRRQTQDKRLGRRSSDAYFPYAPAFVVQSLAQGTECANERNPKDNREARYRAVHPSASGRHPRLKI